MATRSTAAVWACHVHNEVNKSLSKEIFDCSHIGDFYDCGCAEDDEETGDDKEADDESPIDKAKINLKVEKEGYATSTISTRNMDWS